MTAAELRALPGGEALLSSGSLARVLTTSRKRAEVIAELDQATRHAVNAIEVARAAGYSWRAIAAAAGEDENTIRVRIRRLQERRS